MATCLELFAADGPESAQAKCDSIARSNLVCGVFSFLGSSFICFCYLIFKDLRKFAFKLVFFLSLSDVLLSVSDMLGDPQDGTATCTFQAVVNSYFAIASILWTTMIAYCLYATVIKRQAIEITRMRERYMHMLCWGYPAVFTILPATTNSYGTSGGWCWIKADTSVDQAWRVLQLYLPLWCAMGYNAFVYYNIVKTIRNVLKAQREADQAAAARGEISAANTGAREVKMIWRLQFYPLIMLICWFMPTVNRIQNIISPKEPIFFVVLMAVTLSSLQGILNSLAYGFTPSVTNRIQEAWIGCRQGRQGGSNSSDYQEGMEMTDHSPRYPSLDDDPILDDDDAPRV